MSYMDSPDVSISKITQKDVEKLVGKKPVDLGGNQDLGALLTEINLDAIMARSKDDTDTYFLSWQGNKIPRGAEINGQKIGWTQNGQVLSADGKMMGTYDRLVEFGGEKGKDQKMVVYVSREPLIK